MFASLHRLFQFPLVISKQGMNLRSKLLPRSCRILIEQRLDPIVALVKQRPDLLLLLRS
jgi:hypothetical protein